VAAQVANKALHLTWHACKQPLGAKEREITAACEGGLQARHAGELWRYMAKQERAMGCVNEQTYYYS